MHTAKYRVPFDDDFRRELKHTNRADISEYWLDIKSKDVYSAPSKQTIKLITVKKYDGG